MTSGMTACRIYRCSRQDELYLYLRADLDPAALPAPLLKKAGRLTEVMTLDLEPSRKLARVDAAKVLEGLQRHGWYLQLPPDGQLNAHLKDGD
ncbi:MAG TPA: YcgL domain-containing protein [Nevskiaceae bacterium]|nr:YcgL domain-containing protein [Nevskiaceae bacterium]